MFDDEIDFDNEYDQDDVDDEWDDCGLGFDGQCSKAGSEECDWECGRLRR